MHSNIIEELHNNLLIAIYSINIVGMLHTWHLVFRSSTASTCLVAI